MFVIKQDGFFISTAVDNLGHIKTSTESEFNISNYENFVDIRLLHLFVRSKLVVLIFQFLVPL